jgi:hypothetical protein
MPFEIEDARLAARVVALGFPGERDHYSDDRAVALERFANDPEFRRLAQAIGRGLGVVLVDVTAAGDVVLAAEDRTPFAPGPETLLPESTRNDGRRRQLAVLALLAVIAEVFPTEDSLAEVDEAREVLPSEVVQLLVSRAEAAARGPLAATAAPSGRADELRRAFSLVGEVQRSVPTPTGKESQSSLEGIVLSVLRDLSEKGLLRRAEVEGRTAFRPARVFAAHVRYLLEREALDDVLEGLRDARAAARSAAA